MENEIKLMCPKCLATLYGPPEAAGKTVACPNCHQPVTLLKAPSGNATVFVPKTPGKKTAAAKSRATSAPPMKRDAPPVRTITESVFTVVFRLLLFSLVADLLFVLGITVFCKGFEKFAGWIWWASGIAFGIAACAESIWALACLRTIALCMSDASADRSRDAAREAARDRAAANSQGK